MSALARLLALRSLLAVWLLLLLGSCMQADARPGPASTEPSAPANQPAAPANTAPVPSQPPAPSMPTQPAASPSPDRELATFASGCFWCTEAVLEQLDGVLDVSSGYMGGHVDNPTYKQVCSGDTGHAECVQVTFDPARIRYEALLEWFFRSHDPTTLNRQGADEGTQYRSAIFVHSDAQRAAARQAIATYQPSFASPIVTEVTTASRFWPAEGYHQDYFRTNPQAGYCRAVIRPKLKKLGLEAEPK